MKLRTFLILLAAVVLFIWGHSLVPLTSSAEESMSVMKILQSVLDFLNIPVTLTDHFVRKLAHFIEYAAAGAVIGAYSYPHIFTAPDLREKIETGALPLVFGFFIGFIDETIQIFSGRGSAIEDVWLDFAGLSFGAALSFGVILLLRRRQRRN
ncbi:MAG: VanZ family protein [Ruminiclostridium sp.]|nr:VanZ family protein [Ruminiclostridium sp.]